jgi:hypothetical protein
MTTTQLVRNAGDQTGFTGAASRKLKVLVRLDTTMQSARIQVGGTVTIQNLKALYAIARRTNSLVPGMEIVVDLSKAHAGAEALADLHTAVERGCLPEKSDPLHSECRLQVLEPLAA